MPSGARRAFSCFFSGDVGLRAELVGQLLRILLLAFALRVAIEALDFRGPDPGVPRHVLTKPSEREPGPQVCAPFC